MVKAISQYTITDLNDAIIAGVAPLNPTLEQLWIKDIPNGVDELYKWNGSAWAIQSLSLAGLDPVQNDKLEDTSDTAINLDTVIIPALQGRLTVTEDAIKLKVEKSDYNALEGRFTNQQSTIEQMADSIAQKVTHDEYNELTQQVSTQETQILQTSSSVAILATKSESVDGRLTTAEASIVVQSNSIALKAEKSDVYTKTESDGKVSTAVTIAKADIKITTDSIASNVTSLSSTVTGQGNTITSQGTSITQMNNAIALKAEKAEVYTKVEADGKVSTAVTSAKADIKITTDSISSSVTSLSNTVTSQGNTITTQGTSITSLNNSITLKAEKADVYTKVESDGKISTAITTAKSDIKVTTDSIALNVSNLTGTVTSQGTTITSQGTSITSLNNSIALKAEKTDVYTKTEADGKTGTAVATAKADIKITTDGITQRVTSAEGEIDAVTGDVTIVKTDITSIKQTATQLQSTVSGIQTDVTGQGTRLTTAETQVTQNKNNITLKANQTDLSALTGRVSTAESSLTVQAGQIATKVAQTVFDGYASRVTTAESTIVQQANQIALKAEATTVYTKTEADTKLGTKVDNSTYNAKVAEIKVTTDGIASTVSSVSTDLDTAELNITNVTQKANSIESNVTSLTNTVTSQGTSITSQGTSITQMNNAIALKAEKTDVYTKVESDGKISTAVTTAKADIKVTTDGITSTVTAVDNKVNNLKIGGRNLLKNSDFSKNLALWNLSGNGTIKIVEDDAIYGKVLKTSMQFNYITPSIVGGIIKTGDTVIVSFYAKGSVAHNTSVRITDGSVLKPISNSLTIDATTVWKKFELSAIALNDADGTQGVYLYASGDNAKLLYITNIKVEKGTKATDWTPAPEDIDATFNTVNSNITAVDQKATGIQTTVTNLNSTVTGQGTRLSTAETTIGQQATSINLKANATDVYTKTSMDTELGKKVDTTTYSNKMSSIDVSINGINQTVSTQNTTLNGLSGTVTTHTSQISTIDQKADGIALRVTETEGDISGIEGRVGTAETQITANKNAITLKASQSSVDSLGTRVGTAEGTLTVQAGQIATKVAQTAFDSAVGVNKWIARRYDMNLGSSAVVPTFDHIKGKTPVSVIEYSDVAILSAFTGDYFVAHYFTNIYMASPKTVVLSVTNDDGASIFLNGASVYGTGSTTTPTNASVSFRAGWNTLEILHHEYQGAENVNIRTTIASQVDKMTSVIGVGNKDETRLSQAESSIIQTSTAIALKADSTVTTALGNRITTAEGTLTVQAGQIATKVAQTTFDGYANRVTTAESTIVQQGNLIATKVAQTDFDALNGKYTTQQTSITQLTNEISLKVSKIEHDALNDKYVEQQSSIEQLADSITSKVSFVDHDDLTQQVSVQETQVLQTASEVAIVATKADVLDGRITDSEAQIVVQASQIALKASQSSLDTLTGRVGTAESSLTVQAGQIATKVTQTQVDTSISNEKRIKDTRTTNQNPDWYWTNNKTQTVEEFKDRVVIGVTGTATFGVLTTYVPWTDSSGGAITQQYVSADGVFNRRSATGTTWTPWLKSEDIAGSQKKVDDFNTNVIVPIVTRVSTAESSITQQAGQIALKASQSSMDTLTGRVGTAEASIVTQAGQIASKVAQTTFDTGIADAKKEASVRVIDSTTKVFSNVAGYNSNVGAPVGAIVFESPISFSYMTRLDIKGYNYNGATSDIDLSVSFYAYSDKTFINHSYTSKGNFSLGKVRLARSGNNTVIILGDINTVWSYPKVYIEKAVLGFSASPDSYKDGWVSLLKTDLSAYTNMTDVAYGRELESINGAQAKVNLLNTNEIAPLKTRVSTAESSITQQANQIALKVNQTDFNSATGRLSVAESSITQQAGLITTKVEKDGVISSVNQSPEGIKVNANRLDITGIVTFSSMDVPTQNKINVIESTANYANDIAVLNTDVNNYVLNPSFEGKRATGHTVATAKAKADAGVPVGSPQPFVGLQTVKENYATDFFSVKAGEVFIVEGWVASTNSVQTFGLGLETNDSAGTSALLMTGHVGKGTGVWQSFYKTYTIPTGVVKARFASQINATSSFGSWYLTDLRITKLVGDDVIANSANWNSANNFVNTWKTPSKTTINGANIETGSISASMIKTNELVVGQNVQMGTGAVIDWNNVMSKPAIVSPSDVKLTKIDANGVYTGTVIADNVRGGLLSGVQINVDTDIYIGNSVKLGGGIYNTNTVKSIQFNSTDSWIYTNGGSLEFSTSGHLRFVSHANFLSSVSFAGASAVDWGNHAPVAKFG